MLRFTVTGQRLERKDEDLVVANAANFPQISVSFVNSPWNTSNTLGIFTNGEDTYKSGFANGVITVPHEVLLKTGVLYFSLVYKDPIGDTQVTTNRVGIKIEASGSLDGIEPDKAEISTDNIDQIYKNSADITKLDERVTDIEKHGTGGGDMIAAVYDPQGKKADVFKYAEDKVVEETTRAKKAEGDNATAIAENATAISELNQALGGKIEMVKLWENASPNSNFPAQTITLDLSEYDLLVVSPCVSTYSTPVRMSSPVIAEIGKNISLSTSATSYRIVGFDNFCISFAGNTQNGEVDNHYNVPIYVYGIKGVQA